MVVNTKEVFNLSLNLLVKALKNPLHVYLSLRFLYYCLDGFNDIVQPRAKRVGYKIR